MGIGAIVIDSSAIPVLFRCNYEPLWCNKLRISYDRLIDFN